MRIDPAGKPVDSYRVPESRCPKCEYKLDAATGVDGVSPEEGDYTICIGCESVLKFGAGMTLAEAPPQEVVELFMECPNLSRMLNAVKRIKVDKREQP
jgi:hypothetical protein